MNAYYIQDRLEAQSWARHYQQIAREEKEAELADDMEKGLPQHLFESLCIDHLQRHGASKKAITRAFDNDVEFQERMAEHIRYMVETIAHHQVDIDSEVPPAFTLTTLYFTLLMQIFSLSKKQSFRFPLHEKNLYFSVFLSLSKKM